MRGRWIFQIDFGRIRWIAATLTRHSFATLACAITVTSGADGRRCIQLRLGSVGVGVVGLGVSGLALARRSGTGPVLTLLGV